jgi:lysophospholipase L1-like esterase
MLSLLTKRLLLSCALASLAACGDDPEDGQYVPQPDAALGVYDASVGASDGGLPFDASSWADASLLGDASFGDAGSVSGDSGSGDAGNGDAGSDGGGFPVLKPKCVKKDSQVIIIGDSFINWISHKFPEQIKTTTGQDWRMKAVGAWAMGSGGIGLIPTQFDDAIKEDPDAHTVVMDGGGNDVLVADLGLDAFGACKETGSSTNMNCQKIVQIAIDAAQKLMDRSVTAGIRDVVYFFYPHIPEGRLIGGGHPNEILDYALPKVRDFCNSVEGKTKGKLRCHFIDMIPVYKGHIPGFEGVVAKSDVDWFNDDIHPNDKGSQAFVDEIWKVMQAKCLGQKAKDCCEN